jgi:hypothetical protein
MRVRLTIDRVVLDGLNLSPRERTRMLEDLQGSLREQVMAKASGGSPVARHAVHERAEMAGQMQSGTALGQAVVGQVWTNADCQYRGVRRAWQLRP